MTKEIGTYTIQPSIDDTEPVEVSIHQEDKAIILSEGDKYDAWGRTVFIEVIGGCLTVSCFDGQNSQPIKVSLADFGAHIADERYDSVPATATKEE